MPSQLFKDVKKGLPDGVVVLEGKAGNDLIVTADVNEMHYAYSVIFEGKTLIFSFTDRKEAVEDLKAGVHRLSWAFTHGAKGWKHEIKAKVGNKSFKVLESRSEKNKDSPYSSDFALVVVNP